MKSYSENIQRGRKEIWRRQKIVLFAVLIQIPFLPFIFIIVEDNYGPNIIIGLWVIDMAILFLLTAWFAYTKCPRCGKGIYIRNKFLYGSWNVTCVNCGLKLQDKEIRKDFNLSFKSIDYISGYSENGK
jgi:hypothetical protein